MNYTMMSYTMSRQPGFDFDAMYKLTRELDLWGVDMVTLYDKKPEDLRRQADDHGVRIVAHTFMADFNFPDAEARQPALDIARRHLDAAKVLGAPVVMVTTPPKAGLTPAESRRNWIEAFKEIAPLADAVGVILTLENFPGAQSPFVTAADFLEAQREVPSLRLTFDNGNAAGGEDPAHTVEAAAPYIVHAHFKDWKFFPDDAPGRMGFRDGRFGEAALIGEGDVDPFPCIAALKRIGYEGGINIEYESSHYPAADGIRRAVAFLRAGEAKL